MKKSHRRDRGRQNKSSSSSVPSRMIQGTGAKKDRSAKRKRPIRRIPARPVSALKETKKITGKTGDTSAKPVEKADPTLNAANESSGITAGSSAPAGRRSRNTVSIVAAVLVMLCAVALVIVIINRNQSMNAEVTRLQGELADSQNRWQETAREKEQVESELADVEEAIREARLTLDESTAKGEELSQQIQALTELSETLQAHLTGTLETAQKVEDQAGSLSERSRQMEETASSLEEQISNPDSQYTGALWDSLVKARFTLVDGLKSSIASLQEQADLLQKRMQTLPAEGYEKARDACLDQLDLIEQNIQALREELKYYTVDEE